MKRSALQRAREVLDQLGIPVVSSTDVDIVIARGPQLWRVFSTGNQLWLELVADKGRRGPYVDKRDLARALKIWARGR